MRTLSWSKRFKSPRSVREGEREKRERKSPFAVITGHLFGHDLSSFLS